MLADLVVVIHFAFILFVLFGGLLALRWRRAMWLHLPAAAWGVAIELGGWVCPLTPLENRLRERQGERAFAGGFVEHYIVPLIYPEEMSKASAVTLALIVVLINVAVYAFVARRGGVVSDRGRERLTGEDTPPSRYG